jgi:hypothetical protein
LQTEDHHGLVLDELAAFAKTSKDGQTASKGPDGHLVTRVAMENSALAWLHQPILRMLVALCEVCGNQRQKTEQERGMASSAERNEEIRGNKQDDLRGPIMQRLWLTLTFLVMAISPQLVGCAGGGCQILPVMESHIHVDDRQP